MLSCLVMLGRPNGPDHLGSHTRHVEQATCDPFGKFAKSGYGPECDVPAGRRNVGSACRSGCVTGLEQDPRVRTSDTAFKSQ